MANIEPLFTNITRPNFIVNDIITIIPDELQNVINVTAEVVGEDSLNTIPTNTSVTISGELPDPFMDKFNYVEKESSDKLMEPITVLGISNLPPNKDMYKVEQDQRPFVSVFVNINITLENLDENDEVVDIVTETHIFEVIVNNEWEAIHTAIANYYKEL